MKVRFNLVLFSILMIPGYRVRIRVRCGNFVDSYLGMTLIKEELLPQWDLKNSRRSSKTRVLKHAWLWFRDSFAELTAPPESVVVWLRDCSTKTSRTCVPRILPEPPWPKDAKSAVVCPRIFHLKVTISGLSSSTKLQKEFPKGLN